MSLDKQLQATQTSLADPPSKSKIRPIWLNATLVILGMVVSFCAYTFMPETLNEPARRMAGIFFLAMMLWVTEAIPLFATSLLVIMLQVWCISIPSDLGSGIPYEQFFSAVSNPIIFLFLGGFILAKAVQQEKIDVQMAALLLRPFGSSPGGVLAGVMLITATFSMWMSNTATTAMMIVLVQPLALQIPEGDRFRRALILSVPFAANIGGIGTPIGTPPNAIALAQLENRGLDINFFEWMAFSVPLLVIALGLMWVFLQVIFRPTHKKLRVAVPRDFVLTLKAGTVYLCFFVTVFFWLTSHWTGIPTAVIAVFPAAVLTMTRIIGRKDFNRMDWDVLILIAGGIALGKGITLTHLDSWIAALVPTENLSFQTLSVVMCLLAVVMSTVMSHTVATNILLPLGMAIGMTFGSDLQLQVLAVMLAIISSFAMGLPISTPPNVIAYSTNQVSARDIMLVGGLTSCVASVVIILTGPTVVSFILQLG